MTTNGLRFAGAASIAVLLGVVLGELLAAEVPADYKGKPWKGKMQTIPGRLTFAFYDEGGEGVAYHDADKVNQGSGRLNRGPEEKNNFRKDEGVDLSYTKAAFDKFSDGKLLPVDQFYVGWTAQGEWLNYTIDVQQAGTFTLNLLATGHKNNNEATLSLSFNGTRNCEFKIEDTGDYHRWKLQPNVAEITLDKGPQLLTVKFEKQAHASNLLYLEFVPKKAAAREPPELPTARAEVAPEWNARFAGKEGWIGGDGVYSAVLGPDRILWLFGDTLLGVVKDGRRNGAAMVNNTVGVQAREGKDAPVRFVAGKTPEGKPAAVFLPTEGKGWFWPQAAVRVGERLFVFLPRIEKTKDPGAFGFKRVGQWLAVVQNPQDEPEKWRVKQHQIPFAEFGPERERSSGAAVLEDGEHLYVYGYDDLRKGLGSRRLTVARAPREKLDDFTAWRFRTATGWSERPADAVPLASGLATEFSVSRAPGGKGLVLVCTENGLSDRIVGRFAAGPEGPWSDALLLYRCPEMARDKGIFCYAAKAHAWASTGDELVVSYCVNAFEFARLFRDDEVYRPRFVRVRLGPAKEKNP